jgi:hypothetical protein
VIVYVHVHGLSSGLYVQTRETQMDVDKWTTTLRDRPELRGRVPTIAATGADGQPLLGQGLDPFGRLRASWHALGLAKAHRGTAPYAVADVGRGPLRTTSGARLPGVWQARFPGCPV